MKISEVFYSIQGEGPQLGLPAWFIRFSGCNLDCSFCDSKYAKKGTSISVHKLVNDVQHLREYNNIKCKNVVITGGEPFIQRELYKLIKLLCHEEYKVYVETNGTVFKPELIGFATFIVSPKLQYLNDKYVDVLRKWSTVSSFKFVIGSKKDFDASVQLCKDLNKFNNVYFMPMGTTEKVLKKRMMSMAEWIKQLGWGQLTPRLHIELWGRRRGV